MSISTDALKLIDIIGYRCKQRKDGLSAGEVVVLQMKAIFAEEGEKLAEEGRHLGWSWFLEKLKEVADRKGIKFAPDFWQQHPGN